MVKMLSSKKASEETKLNPVIFLKNSVNAFHLYCKNKYSKKETYFLPMNYMKSQNPSSKAVDMWKGDFGLGFSAR